MVNADMIARYFCRTTTLTDYDTMKNKIITYTLGAAFIFASANAEIILTDDLSAYGYIDVAYTDADDGSDLTGGAAEFELGFSFAPVDSMWSAVAEISYDNDASTDNAEFETVTITYAASDELSFTVGNILSYQGFETYDATGLYQYSYSGYAGFADGSDAAEAFGQSGVLYSAGYANGGSADYVTDAYALGAWIGESGGDASLEFLAAYTGIEGLTVKAIYADDPGYETINVWGSYDYNAFTFAVEYVDTDLVEDGDDTGTGLESMMALVYYSFGDAGLTLRYSDVEYEVGNVTTDYTKFTISPSYAFSDNVFGLIEVSLEDYGDDDEVTSFAAELIYSF